MRLYSRPLLILLFAALLSACGPGIRKDRAPVVEYGGVRRAAEVPAPRYTVKRHTVRAGETLYSIAFENGVNYMEMAEYNGLKDPAAIKIGQSLELRIPPDEGAVDEQPATAVRRTPKMGETKTQPKVGRLLYSAEALARAGQIQTEQDIAVNVPSSQPATVPVQDDAADALEWGMPAQGKLIAGFSRSANRKGVDIAGARGQAITASAPGKVVYAGSGLRGYGKLIIIKHNATYLSAYAHNDRILVKEGQNVRRGQQIAEMGSSDADQVKLHFEIRRQGKPVDPARYLPLVKS